MFPIITEELQKKFENQCINTGKQSNVPEICGYYGRACRQMGKSEGANRVLCIKCPLAEFVNYSQKATDIFKEMLDIMEFKLIREQDCYCLIDKQGGNLGNIESEEFLTAMQIADRLDNYIEDYYIHDLEEEYEGVTDNEDSIPDTIQEWLDFAKKPENKDFVSAHQHEFDCLDMLINHIDEVDLYKIASSIEIKENYNE